MYFLVYLGFFLMMMMFLNIQNFLVFLLVSLLIFISINSLVSDMETFSTATSLSYECGFEYSISSGGYSLQFYIIGFSFLLFDLEICLFTPLILSFSFSLMSMLMLVIFLLTVLIAYFYEVLISAFLW